MLCRASVVDEPEGTQRGAKADYRFAVASTALLIFLLCASLFGWLLRDQNPAIASPPPAAATAANSRS
jgi:hypothetical protein